MKIRSGFVSNSSSSSFICNVCGTVESGMDMSASDFDMETCIQGHTFCLDHADKLIKTEPTSESFRESIRVRIKSMSWMDQTRRGELEKEMEETPDEEIEDYYNDNYGDDGVPESQCPICSMVALQEKDGFSYLKKKFNITNESILSEIKGGFKTYSDFSKHIQPSK